MLRLSHTSLWNAPYNKIEGTALTHFAGFQAAKKEETVFLSFEEDNEEALFDDVPRVPRMTVFL